MNKKGFTLVELLAIIIILSIVLTLTYPKIVEQLNKNKEKISKYNEELIFNAGNRYISNEDDYVKEVGKLYCVTIETLDNEGLIPIDVDDYIGKALKIKIGKNRNYITIIDSCKDIYLEKSRVNISLKDATGGGIIADFYKSVTMKVEFTSENQPSGDYYYIKSTGLANQNSNMITHVCGNAVDPKECTQSNVSVLQPNYWYRVKGTLDVLYNYSSLDRHTIYGVVYNGRRYLQIKTATIPPIMYYAYQFSYTNSINGNINDVEAALNDLNQRFK